MSTYAEHQALIKTPEWAAYVAQSERLERLLGNALREKPYDFNGVLIKTGDRVKSTLGLDGFNISEGIAKVCDDPDLPNCIEVGDCTSAASLWELVEPC